MCGKKKGNRRHTTLSLLNADAKALCLRPDPELVKAFGIPPRRRAVESCPSARAKAAPVAFLILVAARTRTRRGVTKNTPARCPARHDNGPGWVIPWELL